MKNFTLKSILTSIISLLMFSLVHSQIPADTIITVDDVTLASGTGQAGGDFKSSNFGAAYNNAVCNFDDMETLMTYYEFWIKFDLTTLEESIQDGEMLLYAEIQLEVTNNTGNGIYVYHLMDIDDWKEGNGNGPSDPDDTGEGMTWDAAQALDYENEANYTLIHTNVLPSGSETFEVTSAIEYELGAEGNKILTLRFAPTISDYIQNDPVYGKKWLGFFTRDSNWSGTQVPPHPAAPRIIFYIGAPQPIEFSDIENFGDIGSYDLTPPGFQKWIVADDEADARLIINGRPAPINGTPGGVAVYNMDDAYGDFDISLKAKLNKIKSGALDPKADFIIAFGYEDGENYSYMRFTGEDINGIYLVDTAGVVEVGDLNATPAVSDTAYHDYRLVRTGTTVTAYIDGAEYLAVTDDALGTEGGIGMGSYNDIALFDDFAEGEQPGAVNDLYQTRFSMYPNPAGDILHIKAENNMQKLVITNIIGQEIRTL
ncbi:MAG: hypothetical protein V3V53_18365, partial [Bacteroidales bacterium]